MLLVNKWEFAYLDPLDNGLLRHSTLSSELQEFS